MREWESSDLEIRGEAAEGHEGSVQNSIGMKTEI